MVKKIKKTFLIKYNLDFKKLQPMPGQLNFNFSLSDNSAKKYFLSIPRKNSTIIKSLHREYQGIDFFNLGGSFRLRPIKEMVKIYQQCEQIGISVPKIIDYDDFFLLREFIKGQLYQNTLANSLNTPKLVISYLTQIKKLHLQGLVLGDRWGPNGIVTCDNKIIFFDFDLSLKKIGKEMELAQAIYYSLINSFEKEKITQVICAWLGSLSQRSYAWHKVNLLLQGHSRYFQSNIASDGVRHDNIDCYLAKILRLKIWMKKSIGPFWPSRSA